MALQALQNDALLHRINASGSPQEEAKLVAGLQHNEKNAWRKFITLYKKRIAQTASRYLGSNKTDIEDIVQDVFLEIIKGIHHFRGEAKLSTWVYRITVNVTFSRKRRAYNKNFSSNVPNYILTQIADDRDLWPETFLLNKEIARKVNKCIERLSPKKRRILHLIDLGGCRNQEAAQILGVSPCTVGTLLHYARKEVVDRLSIVFPELAQAYSQNVLPRRRRRFDGQRKAQG